MKVIIVLSALLAVAAARMAYVFSSGFEEIVGQPVQDFSCDSRQYGYYADITSDCQIFHVCLPLVDDLGETTSVEHFSFFCPNQTVFNQESLTCTTAVDAFPCDQAATLYDLVNSEFGRIPEDNFQK